MIEEIIKKGGYKIMLIDDDDIMYMNMLKDQLEEAGYECVLNTTTSYITRNVFLELQVLPC